MSVSPDSVLGRLALAARTARTNTLVHWTVPTWLAQLLVAAGATHEPRSGTSASAPQSTSGHGYDVHSLSQSDLTLPVSGDEAPADGQGADASTQPLRDLAEDLRRYRGAELKALVTAFVWSGEWQAVMAATDVMTDLDDRVSALKALAVATGEAGHLDLAQSLIAMIETLSAKEDSALFLSPRVEDHEEGAAVVQED
jgi:hypothetical protein